MIDLVEDMETQRLCDFLKVRQTRSPLVWVASPPAFFPLPSWLGLSAVTPFPRRLGRAWKTAWRKGRSGKELPS